MGHTYEVHAWMPQEGGGYAYEFMWAGQRLFGAIRAMRRAKRDSCCVRLEWR